MLNREQEIIRPEEGLPEELFLEVSSLVPIPNVDLFILDEEGKLLLTRRDDVFFGKGWHLPGGCIRFKETMIERVRKTAKRELGATVRIEEKPLAVREVIIQDYRESLSDQNIRAHGLSVLFLCYLHDKGNVEHMVEAGQAKWFRKIPQKILSVHDVYKDVFEEYHLL